MADSLTPGIRQPRDTGFPARPREFLNIFRKEAHSPSPCPAGFVNNSGRQGRAILRAGFRGRLAPRFSDVTKCPPRHSLPLFLKARAWTLYFGEDILVWESQAGEMALVGSLIQTVGIVKSQRSAAVGNGGVSVGFLRKYNQSSILPPPVDFVTHCLLLSFMYLLSFCHF